jgi:serine-type D-Ala-D-Ala carboxypeptidase (penicillin-binding protein 5/6)
MSRVRRSSRRRRALLAAVVLLAVAAALFLDRPRRDPGSQALPRLEARAALLLDADTGGVLYAKKPASSIYPASTAKILTALVALESADPDEIVTVGAEIGLAPDDSSRAGLKVGDRIRMKDLIGGLMLPSGGDAAYAIAVRVARSMGSESGLSPREAVSRFVERMNARAVRAGARRSFFRSPDGYHAARQTTTVLDLALITRAAMAHPLFREIVASEKRSRAVSPRGRKSGERPGLWENRNKLLDEESPFFYPGANGVKTGHTAKAGYCLVASARRGGRSLISVVMDSTETGVWTDSIALLNQGFTSAAGPARGGKGWFAGLIRLQLDALQEKIRPARKLQVGRAAGRAGGRVVRPLGLRPAGPAQGF